MIADIFTQDKCLYEYFRTSQGVVTERLASFGEESVLLQGSYMAGPIRAVAARLIKEMADPIKKGLFYPIDFGIIPELSHNAKLTEYKEAINEGYYIRKIADHKEHILLLCDHQTESRPAFLRLENENREKQLTDLILNSVRQSIQNIQASDWILVKWRADE